MLALVCFVPISSFAQPEDNAEFHFDHAELTSFLEHYIEALSFIDQSLSDFSSISKQAKDSVVTLMTATIDSNRHLDRAEKAINVELRNRDTTLQEFAKIEVLLIATKRLNNLRLLQILRHEDKSVKAEDLPFESAKIISTQNENLEMLNEATVNLWKVLYRQKANSKLTGTIDWFFTPQEKTKILSDIDRLFGAQIKDYRRELLQEKALYSSSQVVALVEALQRMLESNTFEELRVKMKTSRKS